MYDIIIIGAGPAGLTAAVYARRANRSVLVLEKNGFGGQMTFSPKIENFPGTLSASGNEIADGFVEQALSQGAEIELEEVLKIEPLADGTKKVITDSGERIARAVIIATGAKHRLLHVPNEENFIGNGISFCAVCDGAFYSGKNVAVIGGGNSALQEAILLSDLCESVTVIQNLDFLTGEQKLQDALLSKPNVKVVLGTVVKEFFGETELGGNVTKPETDGYEEKLHFDGVFVAIGLAPDTAIAENLAERDKYGYIVADEKCLTATEGVFVAGDCRTKSVPQITTAGADGAVAALAACNYLDK
ncbi:MAG: FAD-dependent oxidoreductase [Clostridiales bacterium]|nr:FAD-dependent oxidoreductase [Candidatus Coliplasma equi]